MKSSQNSTVDESKEASESSNTLRWAAVKVIVAGVFLASALSMYGQPDNQAMSSANTGSELHGRRLEVDEDATPPEALSSPISQHLKGLFQDLRKRQKLFEDTPPEEVKYWFEYSDPLQKYFYRFSRSRNKADYFEGRDDSGVVSARFVDEIGGTKEFRDFFLNEDKGTAHQRLLKNCLAMGSSSRPDRSGQSLWNSWFGSSNTKNADRCRILFTINTVGSGRGSTLLWETNPPPIHAEGPPVWTSEQETAATHLERNLEEINAMCETGFIAARVQMLLCEPISPKWSDWMDAKLVACGGKAWLLHQKLEASDTLDERPSPVQIVVASTAETADTCHDLKSGFMERRSQDLVLAPPQIEEGSSFEGHNFATKTTHPDLFSTDQHDLYVSMKWSSLVTVRSVSAFLQASADLVVAASSDSTAQDDDTVILGPSSPFLIPSFVRMSYVSEENNKVAKWRMHGDFFHPAAWEICKDSFDSTWIPNSLAGQDVDSPVCASETDCGQWWVYFNELQMPTSPEVYANENTPAPVQGGSHFFWMMTEQQRQDASRILTCHRSKAASCPELPQAVMPLGDLESFLINFTPNTALGREHVKDRRPGYSHAAEREQERRDVKKRKQLKDQEEIESALFDYTIYPAALFHKDATLKAARARDKILTNGEESNGPQTCKSSYYDITITKPRPAMLGWCQAVSRRGLCTLYADFFRAENWCKEACGLEKNWSKVDAVPI